MPGQGYRPLLAPQAQEHYKLLESGPRLHDMTLEETRQEDPNFTFKQPDNIAKVEHAKVRCGAGHEVPVFICTPAGTGPFPLIMHFHGGGFWCGENMGNKQLAASYASLCGAVCCSVDYRLCPEDPFPAGVDDCWEALLWATHPAQARALNIDRTKVATAGESAGGNLAAVMAVKAKQEGLPKLVSAQILVCAVVDLTGLNFPSHADFSEELYVSSAARRRYHGWYMPSMSQEQKRNPLLSPLLAPDHSGLAPAFVLTAEVDGLRDEGKAYADKLEAAGVKTQYKCYKGHFHCSMLNLPVFGDEAKQAFLEVRSFLHRVWDLPLT